MPDDVRFLWNPIGIYGVRRWCGIVRWIGYKIRAVVMVWPSFPERIFITSGVIRIHYTRYYILCCNICAAVVDRDVISGTSPIVTGGGQVEETCASYVRCLLSRRTSVDFPMKTTVTNRRPKFYCFPSPATQYVHGYINNARVQHTHTAGEDHYRSAHRAVHYTVSTAASVVLVH